MGSPELMATVRDVSSVEDSGYLSISGEALPLKWRQNSLDVLQRPLVQHVHPSLYESQICALHTLSSGERNCLGVWGGASSSSCEHLHWVSAVKYLRLLVSSCGHLHCGEALSLLTAFCVYLRWASTVKSLASWLPKGF